MAREAINIILSADAAITAMVGDRIYPISIPEKEVFPAITYKIISNDPSPTKDGVSTVDRVVVQVDCWAEKAAEALDLSELVRTALDRTNGTFGGDTIDSINYLTTRDLRDEELNIFGVSADFSVRNIR